MRHKLAAEPDGMGIIVGNWPRGAGTGTGVVARSKTTTATTMPSSNTAASHRQVIDAKSCFCTLRAGIASALSVPLATETRGAIRIPSGGST